MTGLDLTAGSGMLGLCHWPSALANCCQIGQGECGRAREGAMVIHEMDADECRRLLQQVSFGRLACARDNQPYVVPIYFSYDGEYVYGFSTPGRKIEWMRANPLVCLEIDDVTGTDEWRSVLVMGRYEELTDTPEFAPDRARAHQALQTHAGWWQYTSVAGAEWRRKSTPFQPIFYRIRVTHLTGHRSEPRPR